MMTVDIKAVQDKARKALAGRMNIIERSALGYRMERIGNPYWPYIQEDHSEIGAHTQENEWTKRQWDIVQQLRNEVRGWREKHYSLLNEIEKLRTHAKADDTYTIKA